MQADAAALTALIGARVRQARQARGWTLEQLAERAGVSRRMLISVEQGSVNPSLGTLLRISEAVGIGLASLVESSPAAAVRVTRAGEGVALWAGESGGRGLLVASAETQGGFELWDWTLAPGDVRSSDAHAAGTKELIQVQDGALALDVDGETVLLAPGDAISFPGDVPHAYANRTDTAVRFTLAVVEPAGP